MITSEKRHSVEWVRCKNHDDVWSVIGASLWSGDRLFFPLSMSAASRLRSSASPASDSALQLCVLWGQVRASTKNTYRDKLRTDTFRIQIRPIIYTIVIYCFFLWFLSGLFTVSCWYSAGSHKNIFVWFFRAIIKFYYENQPAYFMKQNWIFINCQID